MRNRPSYMSEKRRQHLARLAEQQRKLTPTQEARVVDMRDRGMSWSAIASWFTRNGTPVSWEVVRSAYSRTAPMERAA